MTKTRRETILNEAEDLMSNFLYYDRKEDEELRRGDISESLRAGEVTIDEILAVLRQALEREAAGA